MKLGVKCLTNYYFRRGRRLTQSTDRKLKKLSEKSLNNSEKKVGALLFPEDANAGLLFPGSIYTWDIRKCYSLCKQFRVIDAGVPEVPF